MSRANKVLQIAEKQSTQTAINLILKTVKGWGGFTVGSVPLAKELGFDPIRVNDVLLTLSKRGYLKSQGSGVYKITPHMQDIEGIDPRGKLQTRRGSSPPGSVKTDWTANFGR